ncbi:MAG: beta-N-acetylglucosaminidase domain-containing protein [Myxococcota bacterium]|nr:beta-N-acetylglucosaminidase domain-containing protein [Myxococcota bacterium]
MKLGLIEGFYGEEYSWQTRRHLAQFMAQTNLSFYLYAPKSAKYLRRDWRTDVSGQSMDQLLAFRDDCRTNQIEFGLGLSPYGLHHDWQADGRADLVRKIRSLQHLELDWLAILFDDMPGSLPGLAGTQADILKVVTDQQIASQYLMCPTYYTDAPILDRLFGKRPQKYLEDLGQALDDAVNVFWTGPKVVSSDYSQAHLESVLERLGRKPFIWDNYPVNDGPRMANFLHVEAPIRPRQNSKYAAGWAINPMNQGHLSQIPIYATAKSLLEGDTSTVEDATIAAITACLPPPLARYLVHDYKAFQSLGLSTFSDEQKALYRARYANYDHPVANEIVRWLNGEYVVSSDILTDT